MTNHENTTQNIFQKIKEYRRERKEKIAEMKNKELTFSEFVLDWLKNIAIAFIFITIINNLLIAQMRVPTGSMENTVMTGDFLFVNKIYGPSTPQMIPFFNIPIPYIMLPSPSEPKRGDVIVFIFPGNRDEIEAREFQYYLKRCVAEPGDTLQLIDNELYVNGVFQPLPPQGRLELDSNDNTNEIYTFPISKRYSHKNYGPIRIPKKGDTIYFNSRTDFYDYKIFIEREGHSANWINGNAEINSKISKFYIVEQDYYFGMGDNRDNSSDSRYWGFIPRKAILGSPIICWLSWGMYNADGSECNIFQKIANIRWDRIGRTIS